MPNFFTSVPEKLKRITSGGKLIKEIDGLRFLAIIPVLIQHLTERFERNTTIEFAVAPQENLTSFLASRGFIGVYIFFVISGFVLSLPFAYYKLQGAKAIKLNQYYWRRVTRLEPPYILWMTVFFIVFVFHNHLNLFENLPHYFSSITYTHGLLYSEWSPINPPTWTLEIEIQFYIIAPFLALLFFATKNKVKRRIFNCFLILILLISQQYFKLYTNPYNLTILGHLHYFLIGFMLTDIYVCDWKDIKKSYLYDFVSVIALITLILVWSWDFEFSRRILFVLSLFIFFFSVFKSNYVNRFVSNRWITAIGGMCYTIYLIHLPFAEFFIRFTRHIQVTNYYTVNLLIQLILFLPVVLSLSAIFFLIFEKPFMNKYWTVNLSNKIKSAFLNTKLRTPKIQ